MDAMFARVKNKASLYSQGKKSYLVHFHDRCPRGQSNDRQQNIANLIKALSNWYNMFLLTISNHFDLFDMPCWNRATKN